MFLIPKSAEIFTIVTKTKEYVPNEFVKYVKVTAKELIGASTTSLYRLVVPHSFDIEEFPADVEGEEITEPIAVPVQAVEKAAKNAPKKSTIPIISNIAVARKDGKIILTTTDNNTVDRVEVKEEDISFPDFDLLLRYSYDEDTEFALSVDELERLVKVAKKLKAEGVKFNVKSAKDPVKFEILNADVDGIIMPFRLEDK